MLLPLLHIREYLRDASLKLPNYFWSFIEPRMLISGYWPSYLHVHPFVHLLVLPQTHSCTNSYQVMLMASLHLVY